MASKKKDKKKSGMISTNHTVADNRKAFHEFTIDEKFEAGIVLSGTEVKSLRMGQCSLKEAYVGPHKGEMTLINCHIPEDPQASPHLQHNPKQIRKLLLHKREVNKLLGAVSRQGYTIVPLRLYFNDRGIVKLEIALAKGKHLHDKRQTERKRDWNRDKARIMKEKG